MGKKIELILSFFTFLFISQGYCGVPVLIWESSSSNTVGEVIPALSQLDSDEFSNHLVKKVHTHKPLIALFIEETLSIEDFSWQDSEHKGSFPKLQNITGMSAKVEFIPSVDDPISSLKDLTVSHDYIWKKYDRNNLPTKPGVVLEVKMKDPLNNDDRPDLLRRHDGNIAEIYSQLLAKHSRIIAIFTGKQSSWVELESNRVRREATAMNETRISYEKNNVAISVKSPPVLNFNGEQTYVLSEEPNVSFDERSNYSRLILVFSAKPKAAEKAEKVALRIKFEWSKEEQKKEWTLTSIEDEVNNMKETLESDKIISNIVNKPVVLRGATVFQSSSKNTTLTLNDLMVGFFASEAERLNSQGDQLRILMEKTTDDDNGRVFFTAPIWAGLVTSWILIMVLTYGFLMLMDIKTMDRFDDPKGKTIQISGHDG